MHPRQLGSIGKASDTIIDRQTSSGKNKQFMILSQICCLRLAVLLSAGFGFQGFLILALYKSPQYFCNCYPTEKFAQYYAVVFQD